MKTSTVVIASILLIPLADLKLRADETKQRTTGDCSPAISNVQGNVTLACSSARGLSSHGELHIDRMTRGVSVNKRSFGNSVSFDLIISNSFKEEKWIDRFIIVGSGASNLGCNPNPIVTIKYTIDLDLTTNRRSVIHEPNDDVGLPVTSKIKAKLEHQYCDGYILISFDQAVNVPATSRLSYMLRINSAKLHYDSAYMIPPEFPRDRLIPRFGLTLQQLELAGRLGLLTDAKLFPGAKVVEGDSGPGYLLPIWGTWFSIIQFHDGSYASGSTSDGDTTGLFTGRRERFSVYPELLTDLGTLGIKKETAKTLLERHWGSPP